MEYANLNLELRHFENLNFFKWIINYATLFSKLKGLENMIAKGRKIVCANHPDIGKVIGLLLKTYHEALRFTIREELTIKTKFKELGEKFAKNYPYIIKKIFLNPAFNYMVETLPGRLSDMFPLDISSESLSASKKNMKTLKKVEKTLINNEAVVILQFSKNKIESKYHQDLYEFSKTVSRIAYNLYTKKNINVPVILNIFKGGKGFFPNPLNPTIGYINKPVFIKDYIKLSGLENKVLNSKEVILGFTDFLEILGAYTMTYKLKVQNKNIAFLEKCINEYSYQAYIDDFFKK